MAKDYPTLSLYLVNFGSLRRSDCKRATDAANVRHLPTVRNVCFSKMTVYALCILDFILDFSGERGALCGSIIYSPYRITEFSKFNTFLKTIKDGPFSAADGWRIPSCEFRCSLIVYLVRSEWIRMDPNRIASARFANRSS